MKTLIGVQTELGLYEIGSFRDTSNPRDSALVEFTKDGITWEVMTTRLPGESTPIIFYFRSCAHIEHYYFREPTRGLSVVLRWRKYIHSRRKPRPNR